MSEHKVTENLKQEGTRNSGELVCSCGLSANITHNKRTSLTIAKARLKKLHEAPTRKKKDRKILMDAGGSVLTPDELRDLNNTPDHDKL